MSKNTDLGNLVNGLFVSSTRNVGIGMTAPANAVVVDKGTATASYLQFTAGTTTGQLATDGFEVGIDASGNGIISQQENLPLMVYTNNTERMRITAAGNVGIGITTAASPLTIQALSNGAGIRMVGRSPGNQDNEIAFIANDNSTVQGYLTASNTGMDLLTIVNQPMRFHTNSTERMRITSGGNVGIGSTTPAVKLQVDGTNNQERFRLQNTDSASYLAFTEQDIRMWRPNDSGSALVLATQAISGTWTGGGGGIEFRPLNTLRMTIGPTGNIGAPSGTNIYNASDARLKQNISQITYGLDAIAALNPVKFNWVDGFEPSEDGKDMLGFVAQEVLEVLPEAIEAFGSNSITIGDTIIDNPLRVNEKFIIPVLVKAIQELKAEIEILKQK